MRVALSVTPGRRLDALFVYEGTWKDNISESYEGHKGFLISIVL
jgi:hypothetical protein